MDEAFFVATLGCLQENLPMGKTMSEAALTLAWGLFPLKAKAEVDSEQLLFAVQQRILDPEPAIEQAITQQLLRYLYPLANNQPNLEQGLRRDLAQRMAVPQRFHPLHQAAASRPAAQVLEENRLLAPAGDGAIERLTLATKPLVLAARSAKEPADAPNTLTPKEQELGCLLAAGTLIGRWSLNNLDRPPARWPSPRPYRNLAREWIAAHPNGYTAMQAAANSAQESPSRSTDAESHPTADEAALLGLLGASDGFPASLAS